MKKNRPSSGEAALTFPLLPQLRRLVEAREPQLVRMTSELVHVESPSHDKAGVDRASALVAEWCAAIGGRIRLHRQRELGDLLEVRFKAQSRSGRPPILLLGHLDTVWEMGTLARMPWRQDAKRISGPGVLDMKAGVAMAITALQALMELKALSRSVILLLHSDEEIGSPCSRTLTEKIALECEAVYVLEPAQGEAGAYKTARKGVGQYRVAVTGVASHSGVDFSSGHSAIVELAHQIGTIRGLTDLKRGLTVNPGVIGGGTASNVIAAQAWAEVDVRIAKPADAARIDRLFRKLRVRDRGCKLEITGGLNRPPMERTAAIGRLFSKAQTIASELGFALDEAATGGGSDGNFTAALGIPTLDGMGAVGAGAHADHEFILSEHLAPRTTLLAAMIMS